MTMVNQDTIYQYLDGKVILSDALIEREKLLQKLEHLAKAPQYISDPENVAGFPVVRAQALLFELCVIGEYIDTLVAEINRYAVRCGKPRVNIIETGMQYSPGLA